MKKYDVHNIENKWQNWWKENNVFSTKEDTNMKKFYGLIEFPYPSGEGLHVGHIRAFTSIEVVARKKRLEGYNVLFPIGWDAFGLPTENYAIKTKQHPRPITDRNIKNFTRQLEAIGYSFNWDRIVDTTDSNFYKWTQWIFIQMFKKGLAYKDITKVNYCNSCQVVLANEESQNGVCDRCKSKVIQKDKEVWFLRISKYSESLLQGLETLDYPEHIKAQQRNWIGKSEGAKVAFKIRSKENDKNVKVFTTRVDTLFGVTFLVVSPEHPLLSELEDEIKNIDELKDYQQQANKKTEFERTQLVKDKTGVVIQGIGGVHPITGVEIPIFVSDYVMMGYGTGAIMAVPAHDERDWEFARKYNLKIIPVIQGGNVDECAYSSTDGMLINSEFLNGLPVNKAKEVMTDYLKEKNLGNSTVVYKMKDWAFNRQRYWGEPIPIVYCDKCGTVPVNEIDLPVELPDIADFAPGKNGESPLASIPEWYGCKCPKCGGYAKRETDTMPQWAGSSWYYLRYMSPKDDEYAVNPQAYKYWGQVDWYNGGMEHVTRHLIYSRFWNQFLYEIGVVSHKEPYLKRSAQGLILGEDGEKMSKSAGNVVNPDDIVKQYGADVLRTFILFIGDYEKSTPWQTNGIKGCKKFLEKVYDLQKIVNNNTESVEISIDEYVLKVTNDIDAMKFNTAIATLMTLVNEIYSKKVLDEVTYKKLLIMLNPIAPHITEEIWNEMGYEGYVYLAEWPKCSGDLTKKYLEIPVQINGRVKGTVEIEHNEEQESVKCKLMKDENLKNLLQEKSIVKEIFVPNKIYNFVVR